MDFQAVEWVGGRGGHARLLDQTRLPLEEEPLEVETVPQMVDAIRRLAVRGAPAIGLAAAYGVLLAHRGPTPSSAREACERTNEAVRTLAASRPTAKNLFWILERMQGRGERAAAETADGEPVLEALYDEAFLVRDEITAECRRMGELGAELIADGARVLTHCNAGALATGGIGTALAPIYVAAEAGRRVRVFADETRPLLQGARLTAWELKRAGIDVTLITDGAAASLMRAGAIDLIFVGSDRIARNGDVCNKIGTYSVAVAAQRHGIPFYVVAPLSTFDPDLATGDEIPIEERAAEEITEGFGPRTAPADVDVYNPAFDVTPAALVRAIVTEVGTIEHPDTAGVEAALRRGGRIPAPA